MFGLLEYTISECNHLRCSLLSPHNLIETLLTIANKLTLFAFAILVIISCNTPVAEKKISLKTGEYELLFAVGENGIPVRLSIDSSHHWTIHNWNENIPLESIKISGATFHIDMPLFNTSLDGVITTDSTFHGNWTDHSRDSLYQISFTATHHADFRPRHVIDTNLADKLTYEVVFSPDSIDDLSKAIGIFYRNDNTLVGTFLTESGDYRFLEGEDTGKSLHLSSFDGAHLFYFCANREGNQLTDGKFYSGKHWSEEWRGAMNATASLRNPDSLTFVQDKKTAFSFSVRNFAGDSVLFDSFRFAGHVSVVQIFGSWCPNCTDESVFMRSLYQKLHDRGLEIIPIAFERTEDISIAKQAVLSQFEELNLEYTPYFGGASNKGQASKTFNKLSKITSYPTMVIVDKKGVVRKIHTGFYGPGTGEHYDRHTAELTEFIEQLLSENQPPM